MERPPLFRRSSLRQRHSLQETAAPSMRSVRRLENRHSMHGASSNSMSAFNSLEVSLLEHLRVQFTKAIVPASKLSRPRYVMKVTNVALNRSWEMVRPYRDFYEMKEALLRALDHGHLCRSNCPWTFMFISHHFPRRHLFRSRLASVVSGRLSELETFVNTLMRAMKEQRSLECAISGQALPKILYDFLYEGMVFDRTDFANTILESRVSLGGSGSGNGSSSGATAKDVVLSPENECSICKRALKATDSFLSVTRVSDPSSTASSSLSSSSSEREVAVAAVAEQHSLTTLECGHRFHDECILAKLNQSLECPVCLEEAKAA